MKNLLTLFYWMLLTVAVGFLQTAAAQNRSYYFDNQTGNDENPGSLKKPWKSIGKLNALVIQPGDKIYLKAGQVFAGNIALSANGTAKKPVELLSYGTGKAIIDAGNGIAILLKTSKFISVKNLVLRGNGRKNGNINSGLFTTGCSDIVIDEIEVNGFQKSGLRLESTSNAKITNVNAHDNGFAGIEVLGKSAKSDCQNLYIGHCRAENNPGDPTLLTNHSGNGIIVGLCRKVTVEYCIATNNGWDMPRTGNGPVGIWAWEADSVIIQHCLSYRNKTSPGSADGGGFDLDGGVTNSIIQYCLSYENHGSGFGIFQYAGASNWYNNTIRFNISENDGTASAKAGVYVWNSSRDSSQFRDCRFYNNVIYNDRGAAISYSEESERAGFVFYNNIFVAKSQSILGEESNDVFRGNNWWVLDGSSKMKNERDFKFWVRESLQSGNRSDELNINPEFASPGDCNLNSTGQLENFKAYIVPGKSKLRMSGLDLKKLLGFDPGKLDFNQKPILATGIGASF